MGGHIATYASATTLYETGYRHFFRAATPEFLGDMLYIQGHSAPGIYARAYLEGRLSEDELDRFRREIGGGGLASYPHPRTMPGFWQFPTVSMGLGPLMAAYQARYMRYLEDRELIPAQGRKVWGFLGDGEQDQPETLAAVAMAGREARQPDLRGQLQPATPGRSGARQRQDHAGAGKRVSRRRLERDQGGLGRRLGRAAGPGP